jgi:hypothetical protein
MQKKLLTKILTAILCISFSCTGNKKPAINPHILSSLPHIRALEEQDHNFCSDLKINFDKSIDLQSSLYWRCRISLAKHKIRTDSAPDSHNFNLELSDLITKISLKLADTPESILINENNRMDDRDHQKCLKMGYQIFTEDQAKIDDYFACRRALILDYKLIPPFGNFEYLEYPNHSYNVGFVVDRYLEKSTERLNLAKENYPTCIKFHLDSINYKNCAMAQDLSRQCFSEINKKKFLKEMEEKILCQKMAYVKFPNEFLKEDERKKAELERRKNNSDFYNSNSFAAIGVDSKDFATSKKPSEENAEEKAEKEIVDEKNKEINSKAKLYEKFELTRLRQKYIFLCQKEADSKVVKYIYELEKSCADTANFVETGK